MNLLFRFLALGCLLGTFTPTSVVAQEAAKDNSYQDGKYDFSIEMPAVWKSAKLQDFTVPGILRAAYASEKDASVTLFVQEAGPFDARFLVDESAKAIEKGLGAKVIQKEVRKLGGKTGMWLVVQGKGTGGAIDGQGSVSTTQHWVAVPRETDVIVVLLTSTTESFKEHEESFAEALKKLKVGGKQTAEQAAVK